MVHNNAYFGACLFSAQTQHENLIRSLVTVMSREIYLFCRPIRETDQPKLTQLQSRETIWKKTNDGETTGKAEIRTKKQFVAEAKRTWLYSDPLQGVKGNINLSPLGCQ